jgi:hypothetical protein
MGLGYQLKGNFGTSPCITVLIQDVLDKVGELSPKVGDGGRLGNERNFFTLRYPDAGLVIVTGADNDR